MKRLTIAERVAKKTRQRKRVPFRVWLWAWLWWPFDAWNNWKNRPTTGGGEGP